MANVKSSVDTKNVEVTAAGDKQGLTPMNLNIYQKLQKCRVGLTKTALKKSGKNTYSNYDYYELSDFLPQINELMDKYGLTAIFNYTSEMATLTIIDTDKIEDSITFTTPIEVTQLKGCQGIQNIGGTQTFARRYLYIMAFEVSENDLVNISEEDEEKAFLAKKIDMVKIASIRDMLKKTESEEAAFCEYLKIKSIEDITNGNYKKCMDILDNKLNQMIKAKAQQKKAQEQQEELDLQI